MKTRISITLTLALLALSILNSQFATAFAQGSLIPPGPPGPTMLTLSQIEPRTPIATNTTPGDATDVYIINQAGSYYLTGNLTGVTNYNAIEILANNVTLDLNGFTIQAVSTNLNYPLNNAVYIPNSQTNITVRNGVINGWSQGVFSVSGASANLSFERLSIANCYYSTTVATVGMNILGPAAVRNCTFDHNYYGVSCNGAGVATGSQITGCVANDNWIGIFCGGSGLISGCTANNNNSVGIDINNGGSSCVVSDCTANNNLYGILIYGPDNRIENNHITATSGDIGISIQGGYTNNIIIKNSVIGAGANNYQISSGQITGPIISATGTISSSNPWANFSF